MSMSPQITAWQGAKGYALSARLSWRYSASALPLALALAFRGRISRKKKPPILLDGGFRVK
ncbi:hypothetical protein VNC20_12375, partial [Xanthomonas arboricola pv. pruni]|uniref:hypothetical protein n=1 Tax=Xanthomonas arboricola TaxID=56448 RepID=UPI002F41193C